MKARHLVLISCATLSVACGSDPLTSDAYVSLSEEVSVLNDQERDLADQVSAAEEELARVLTETATTDELAEKLQGEIDDAKLEISAENERESQLSDQLSDLRSELSEINAEIADFKENSSKYQSAVRQSISPHQRYLCQQDWKSDLSPLFTNLDFGQLASNVGSESRFPAVDMRTIDPDFDDIDCGFWGEDKLFGSERTVLNRVCEQVNLDKLKKNPSTYLGKCFRGTNAYVAQFDTNTGPRTFHATLGSRYGDRVEFELYYHASDEPLYEGVRFNWWAVGNGELTYNTSAGGTNTIPSFTIFWYSYYS